MLMMVLGLACIQVFDISSAVVVLDDAGMAIDSGAMTFCQSLTTSEKDEQDNPVVQTQCQDQSVLSGVADLSNWEGTYKRGIEDIQLWVQDEDEQRTHARLLDSDEDVWCDNVDVDYDIDGYTSSTEFCTSNYEFYFLWTVEISTAE